MSWCLGVQAQKQAASKPASAFQLQEAEGMEDLLSLMHSMSVAGAAPQANGDLTGHAHAAAGMPCHPISADHPGPPILRMTELRHWQ